MDTDCFGDYVCQPVPRAEGGVVDVCVFEDPTDEFCSSDLECRNKLDEPDALCSIDNLCYVPLTIYSILIRDTSPINALGNDGLAGSDIAAVYLTLDDKIVAQGATILAKNDKGEDLSSPINGGPIKLNSEMACIDGNFSEDTIHLGLNGYVLVQFLDTSFGDYLERPSTWNINVIEWGNTCGIAEDPDTYEVLLCSTSSYENIDFDRECVQIGTGGGFSKFTTETQ